MLVLGALQAETMFWQWRSSELPFPIEHSEKLVAALGNLYLIAHQEMFAFDGDDGHLLWQHHPGYTSDPGLQSSSGPSVRQGRRLPHRARRGQRFIHGHRGTHGAGRRCSPASG